MEYGLPAEEEARHGLLRRRRVRGRPATRGRAEAVVASGHRRRELAQVGTKRKSGEASSARDECLLELLTTKKSKVEGSALAKGEEAPTKRMTRLP